MSDKNQNDFTLYKIEELKDFQLKKVKDVESDELLLKLFGALPVNIEKEFVPRYVFDIVLKNENKKIGFITIRAALTQKLLIRGGHNGYGIDEKYRGHNYAEKAMMMLKPLLKDLLGGKILITCDTDNISSRKTIERIGGKLIRIEKQIENPEENIKKDCCYYQMNLE
jgi:predicted acetyltransferase